MGLWQASREYPKTVKFMTKLTVLTDEILTKLFPYCETERHFDETLCALLSADSTVRSEKSVTAKTLAPNPSVKCAKVSFVKKLRAQVEVEVGGEGYIIGLSV